MNDHNLGNGPYELKLEVTNACPLRCLHCSVNAGSVERRSIPQELALALIREFADIGGKILVLTGGEPLCNPMIHQLALVAKMASLRVILYTTGLTTSEGKPEPANEIFEKIADLIDVFVFCLHGTTANIHDHITQISGSFDATLMALRRVICLNKQVIVHHVPLRFNVGELLSLCALLENLGITSLKLLRFIPQGRGETNRSQLELDEAGVHRLTNEIAVARDHFKSLSIDLGTPYAPLGCTRNVSCKAGWGTLSVNASLECSPCDGFKTILGGAFNEPLGSGLLAEFWYKSPMLWAIRKAGNEAVQASYQGCLAQKSLASGQLCGTVEDPLFSLTKVSSLNAVLASL